MITAALSKSTYGYDVRLAERSKAAGSSPVTLKL